MSPTSPPRINHYSLTDSSSAAVLNNALKHLKPHLPVYVPIYRRLQFGRFFDATCLLTNLSLDSGGSEEPTAPTPWFLAFVDRSCRPETEVWFCGSWEVEALAEGGEQDASIDELVRHTVQQMKQLGVPTSIHQDLLDAQQQQSASTNGDDTDSAGFSRSDYGGHASDTNIMLWGAVHEKTARILQRLGLLSFRFKTALQANFTFIWDADALPPPKALPEGLRWGELKNEHFALVRSRTQIPRQDRTLAVLPNLGIFPAGSEAPIAWVFVGLDSSLTSLHVEPEYRGKGLAKTITTKLFKEKLGMFWEEGVPRWTQGYVIVGNKESEGMCRSLGGRSDWEVFWVRVDLGTV